MSTKIRQNVLKFDYFSLFLAGKAQLRILMNVVCNGVSHNRFLRLHGSFAEELSTDLLVNSEKMRIAHKGASVSPSWIPAQFGFTLGASIEVRTR
jgi:hypothetical protein